METGALVYMIPNPPKGSKLKIRDLVADLDGLILEGGSDVSPKSYGEEPLRPEWGGDFIRDQYEIALLKEFKKAGKPVLGVCRGAQLINVAFGGTLYQDIETQIPAALVHRNWDIYDQLFHEIDLVPGSGLARMSKQLRVKVNSVHHQAIKDLGRGLVVEARSSLDRVAEAISAEFNCQSIGPTQIRGLAEPLQLHMISGRGAETKERKAA
jgi:putative glutamine amidotransferase